VLLRSCAVMPLSAKRPANRPAVSGATRATPVAVRLPLPRGSAHVWRDARRRITRLQLKAASVASSSERESIQSVAEHVTRLLGVLEPVLDVVSEPVEEPEPPSWCRERGWTEFLLGLDDRALDDWESRGLESVGLESADAPAGFRELFREVRALCHLPSLGVAALALPPAALRGVPARKREQLGALLAVLSPLAARAERVVDIGAGRGHFARLSAELFGRATLALDRNASLLERGRALREERGRDVGGLEVEFVDVDLSQQALALRATDLAVGLHACGGLGDRLVMAASQARCDLALVSCCLQKIDVPRRVALSRAAGGFSLRKSELGLTNLTLQAVGVEATLSENLRAREVRLALKRLLRERGLVIRAGEEMIGVNRRRAHAGLAELASRVLAQRGLPAATPAELKLHSENAHRDYAAIRRLSLPRHLLARLVELAVVFDRAAALEESGLHVRVAQLFENSVTPRNTVLLASASPYPG
jgi:SAM-dependent methyltransferase